MKTIKLLLKSLFSNNTTIDGARKKPWYFAVILFIFSIAVSLVPIAVQEGKNHLDTEFENTTWLTQEAVTSFSQELQKSEYDGKMYVVHDKEAKTHTLMADTSINYEVSFPNQVDYLFVYLPNEVAGTIVSNGTYNGKSYFIFTSDTVYIKIVNPNDHNETVLEKVCINAYKKIGENDFKELYESVLESDGSVNFTSTLDKTWANWKPFLRKLYNASRLTSVGRWVLVFSIVNVSISLIMGFMVWVLTRGKNNPYRLFTVWESFKIVFWAGLCPGLLTCGFGFLFTNFARTMFPLLLGIRVMWLSMKSLRPDGSGYAAD